MMDTYATHNVLVQTGLTNSLTNTRVRQVAEYIGEHLQLLLRELREISNRLHCLIGELQTRPDDRNS